jgi:hypothetical protein
MKEVKKIRSECSLQPHSYKNNITNTAIEQNFYCLTWNQDVIFKRSLLLEDFDRKKNQSLTVFEGYKNDGPLGTGICRPS